MKIVRLFLLGLMGILLGISSLTHAEDIDIYSDNTNNAGVPNVLFVLDNSANFSAAAGSCLYNDPTPTAPTLNGSAGGIEQCALYNVIKGLPVGSVNIGLMVYNDTKITDINEKNCGDSNGGCLAYPLTLMDETSKPVFLNWVKSWKKSESDPGFNIKGQGKAIASTMQEAWAYYAGSTGLSGRSYAGVQPTAGCQKNFIIYVGNAVGDASTPGDGGNADPIAALAAAPGVTDAQKEIITDALNGPYGILGTNAFSCGTYSVGNSHNTKNAGLYADEWARYMRQTDIYSTLLDNQGITTYTVGLLDSSCKPDYPALLSSMATVGGGKYYATSDYNELSVAILKILNEIQAVNSVFSSASLPVSVNAQGTYLNQIFLGMFRPDASANPRWVGNLKQYQFVLEYPDPLNPDPNKATLKLGDSAGNAAISSAGTGFITPDAVSYWTKKDTSTAPDSTGGFFFNDSRGAGGRFDSPDGELVEKGGAAQQLRLNNLTVNYASTPSSPRRLYTYCPSGLSCNPNLSDSANAFATSNANITDAMLNAIDSVNVTSITRSGPVATVTTGTNHVYAIGDLVRIAGASPSDYNGTKMVLATPAPTANQFSFAIADYPPSPAIGTFSASKPSSPQNVSLVRSGTTVTATTSSPHGFTGTLSALISNAVQTEYNGQKTITELSPTEFTFTLALTETPPTLAGGGSASVGTGSKCCEAIKSVANSGVVRASGSTTVRVTTSNPHSFTAGSTVVITGVVDAIGTAVTAYNQSFLIAAVDAGKKWFEFALPTSATINPATPATIAAGFASITVDNSAAATAVTLSRIGSEAIAIASSGHSFVVGDLVNITGTPGANEANYLGSYKVKSINGNEFRYDVVLSPATSATGAMSVSKTGTSDRTALINWVRGEDNYGDEASPGSSYTVRPSVHGDVLHSRPVAINFGTDAAPKVVVFYGGNDGVFRAVNGNQTGSITSGGVTVAPGGELWGLILPEHYGKLNRQRVNSPELKLPSTALASAQPKDYFVDGSPGVYQKLNADGTVNTAYLYLTMRRGGRFIYAVDVSVPGAPTVLWKKGVADDGSADAGFGELGQTWSRPRVTLVKGYANPVLVFGGGYDPAEDAEPPTADTMGRGVFVLDAVTGERVWSAVNTAGTSACSGSPTQAACVVAGMNYAIPADISFVDRDNDGKTDRFYAADLGGNVWRVDLEPGTFPVSGQNVDMWKVTKFAALGCATGSCASGTTPRKFFFPPNVLAVGATGASGSYDVVLLGSGDREHPLKSAVAGSSYNVANRFYALKDTTTGKDTSGITAITEANLFNASSTAYDGSLSGFYVSFVTGEKSVNASTTLRGTTFFGTNKPTPPSVNSCSSNLGEAKGYALNPFSGTFTSAVFDGGGLPPSPTTGIVTILVDGKPVKKEFCVGCGGGDADGAGGGDPCNSALEACTPTASVPKNPRRTYWYKK